MSTAYRYSTELQYKTCMQQLTVHYCSLVRVGLCGRARTRCVRGVYAVAEREAALLRPAAELLKISAGLLPGGSAALPVIETGAKTVASFAKYDLLRRRPW